MKTTHSLNYALRHAFTLLLLLAGLLIHIGAAAQESTDPATVESLAPAQEKAYTEKQFSAERARLEIENQKMGLMLGRTMPFAGMALTIVILIIVFGTMRHTDRNRHETIRKYLELGIEVPERLLIDPMHPNAGKKPLSDKRKAIIWISVGLGIAATVYLLTGNQKSVALGIIPLSIGIGYFIAAILIPENPEETR